MMTEADLAKAFLEQRKALERARDDIDTLSLRVSYKTFDGIDAASMMTRIDMLIERTKPAAEWAALVAEELHGGF